VANAGYTAKVERDWDIPQGADTANAFIYGTRATAEDPVVYVPFITDGWTARAQIRSAHGGDIWATFLSSDTTGSRIELTDTGGVTLVLPAAVTEDEAWNSRFVGFYDVEIIDSTGYVTRLATGQVNVSHDYTRTA